MFLWRPHPLSLHGFSKTMRNDPTLPPSVEQPTPALQFGAWVLFLDEPWFISRVLENDRFELRRPGAPDLLQIEGKRLRPILGEKYQPGRLLPLDAYPISKQAIALERRRILDRLLKGDWGSEAFRQSAKELEKSLLTLRRYLNAYILYGLRVEVLIPCAFRYGVVNRRILSEVETVIEEAKSLYLDPERYSDTMLCSHVRDHCRRRSLPPPCDATILKRFRSLPQHEIALKRLGAKRARELFAGLPGKLPVGAHPLAFVEADNTPLNILCRLPNGKNRRLYLTLIIDRFTRMVLGYYLSFEKPSRLSFGMALYQLCRPKQEILDELGICGDWPCHGKPELLQTDNGLDLIANDIKRICFDLGVSTQHRKLKQPDTGGIVERMMGTQATCVEVLPGKTFRDLVQKGDYPSGSLACLTYREIEYELVRFIVNDYHVRGHRGLRGRTPLSVWKEAEAKGQLPLPDPQFEDPKRILGFLPTFTRTIQRDGVTWEGQQFYDPRLVPYIKVKNPESEDGLYRFAYDQRDVRFIYFRRPKSSEWLRLQARDLGHGPVCEWEQQIIDEEDRIAAKATEDTASLERERSERLARGREYSRRARQVLRKAKQRKTRAKEAASQLAPERAGPASVHDFLEKEFRPALPPPPSLPEDEELPPLPVGYL